jgi:hypothetical protein
MSLGVPILKGDKGDAGATGATGAAGPNEITTSTTVTAGSVGQLLIHDTGNVAGAVPDRVPYSGATGDVNLGDHGLAVGNPLSGLQVFVNTAGTAGDFSDGTNQVVLCNSVVALAVVGQSSFDNGGITTNGSGTLTAVAFAGPLTGDVTGNCSGSSGSCSGNAATATDLDSGSVLGTTKGGTGANNANAAALFTALYENVATTLGDLVYGGASGAPTRLAGNTTATKKYLQSVSSGAPSWQQIAYADISGTPSLSGYVPYTGATGNVELGANLLYGYGILSSSTGGSGGVQGGYLLPNNEVTATQGQAGGQSANATASLIVTSYAGYFYNSTGTGGSKIETYCYLASTSKAITFVYKLGGNVNSQVDMCDGTQAFKASAGGKEVMACDGTLALKVTGRMAFSASNVIDGPTDPYVDGRLWHNFSDGILRISLGAPP